MPTRNQVNTSIATNLADNSDITAAELRTVETIIVDYVDQQDALKVDKVTGERLINAAEITKLAGVAPSATANATDAQLRDRSTHTGTQTSASISDFTEAVQDAVGALLGAGSNVIVNYDDAANTLTISSTAGTGSGLDAESVRDVIGAAIIGVGNITVAYNDSLDTITVSTTATQNSTDAALRDRSTHTGTQTASTISDFNTAALAAAPAETGTTTATILNGATAKTTPVDADTVPLIDSAASNVLKKLSWANIKATLKTYFDSLYQVVLVSGTNIKTINGTPILGSGDITVSGSGDMTKAVYDSNNDGKIDATALPDFVLSTTFFEGAATTGDPVVIKDGSITSAKIAGPLTGIRINPRIQSVTSAATVTPNADNDDGVKITAQAVGLTIANPSGTPVGMQSLVIRIKDNGTARSISFGTQYRAIGITLPTTTVISKTMYLGLIYNADDAKWDIIGLSQEA